jgi:hypothetical protein
MMPTEIRLHLSNWLARGSRQTISPPYEHPWPGRNPRSSNGDGGDRWWRGLHIATFWDGGEIVLRWQPATAGASGDIFDDEVIESLICHHCVFGATTAAYLGESRDPGTEPLIRYVPVAFRTVRLRPVAITNRFAIGARIREVRGERTRLTWVLTTHEVECARGDVITVRVHTNGGD